MQVESTSPQERFQSLLRADSRYHSEAYSFVFEALDYTVRARNECEGEDAVHNQHVTGPELLGGVREFALETFGCMALSVFRSWGIRESGDFGEIVFNLVEHGLMGKQESDRKEDFQHGWGGRPLDDVFQVVPVFEYDAERDEWKATYESVVYG